MVCSRPQGVKAAETHAGSVPVLHAHTLLRSHPASALRVEKQGTGRACQKQPSAHVQWSSCFTGMKASRLLLDRGWFPGIGPQISMLWSKRATSGGCCLPLHGIGASFSCLPPLGYFVLLIWMLQTWRHQGQTLVAGKTQVH